MIVTFERDIKNELIELEKKVTKILESSFNNAEPIKPTFTKVLKEISSILYKTSLKHEEWHPKDENDKQFSFFPGYITNKGDRVFNIAFLEKDNVENTLKIVGKNTNGYEKFNLDFWFNESTNNQDFDSRYDNISLLSIAYHFLFLGKEDGLESKGDFSPEIGGTHQWASMISDEIAINDFLDPLELLAFYDNKKEARNNQLKYKTWISIPFDLKEKDDKQKIQEEIYNWCESIVNKLDYPSNNKSLTKCVHKWPLNPNCEKNGEKEFLIYRAYIVAFWMQLVLSPDSLFDIKDKKIDNYDDKSEMSKAWFEFTDYFKTRANPKYNDNKYFDFRQKELNRLKLVLLHKNNIKKIVVHNYKYWYTIPFRHRLDFSPNDATKNFRKETGSAMILSNYLLDGEYFRFIIPWINQMYDAMREYDTAFEASEDKKQAYNDAMIKAGIEQTKIDSVNDDANTYQAEIE